MLPSRFVTDASKGTAALQHVFRWDLDKTYLHTNFDTWLDIVRTAVEKPEGKRTVAGAAALIRELRATIPCRITILSGSPEQMRNTLEAKLRLDGVQWDEFVLKPSLRNLVRLRFRALRDQVGYKLPALLAARTRCPVGVPETLFGDDAEADALVYSLYADILAGRVDDKLLTAVMEHAQSYPDAVAETIRLVHKVERADPVRRIFIHLERRSDPAFFRRYGARVVPITHYFQAALVLTRDGVLSPASAAHVATSFLAEGSHSADELVRGAADLVARGHLTPDDLRPVAEPLAAAPALDAAARETLARGFEAITPRDATTDDEADGDGTIDYLAALFDDRARWEAASREAKGARRAKRRPKRDG